MKNVFIIVMVIACQSAFAADSSGSGEFSDAALPAQASPAPQAQTAGGSDSGSSTPATQCLIYVSTEFPSCVGAGANAYYKVSAGFVDTDGVANVNAGRCLERALEYANWCGDGNKIKTKGAYAYFVVNGKAVINDYADTATQKTVIGDGISRTLRFHD